MIKIPSKKVTRILRSILSILIWISLSYFCVYSLQNSDSMQFSSGGIIIFTFGLVPFLMVGALYGYLLGLITFSVSFLTCLIFYQDSAFKMSIFLMATVCFAILGQYNWFSSIFKTFLGALITLILVSLMELVCLSIITLNEYSLGRVADIQQYFTREAITIFAIAFLLHFFFTKAPDISKIIFPIGYAYTNAYRENTELQAGLRKTKVSVKITVIIFAMELILGLFVAIYMVVLFPDIKGMFAETIHSEHLFNDDITLTQEDILNQFDQMRFRLDSSALTYDIKMILLMLCVGVPMAGFANWYTKTRIGAPLGIMSDFMKEYAKADGDTKIEVGHKVDKMNIKTHDEIQIVHESIQDTVHAIEEYIGQLNAEYELEKELEVAQKASEAKSTFLSSMSHEIRTPINAVLGLNEMILRESSDEQILEYASGVKSAGSSLLSVINDILDFSKIEAGKLDILPAEYHLGSTINDLVNMVAIRAENKGLALNMNIEPTLPSSLIGDETRIKQCVTNLLTNAVKYTEEGSVTLNISYRKCDRDSIFLKFQVIDTGIGIKEEDLNKLYSPFERIEEIRNRSIEGTGLGMSIVKNLLALMGTHLEVKSVYGRGSDFSFEIKQQVASWDELGDFREKYKEFLKTQEKYHERFRAPEAEILVVDDTPINLTVVKGLLKETQIKVDTAESGRETLDKVRQKRYDVIFIDHRMPEMDGIETLEAMKELEGNLCKDTPCIALTANAGAGAREEYIAAGFNDYLSKPVNGTLLEKMLEEYLPKEKLSYMGPGDEATAKEASAAAADSADASVLNELQGIDLEEAVKNCGSRDLLKDVVKEFLISIDSKADSIQNFADQKDYRNYTVAVHALKSSARLIGAMELSGLAAHLEECGNREDEASISSQTPELLNLFRSYNEKLAAINEGVDESSLPEIDSQELQNAFSDMKELLEAYDFDTADGIMNMLSEYRIPDEYKDKYNKIKQLMAAVDRDALLELL